MRYIELFAGCGGLSLGLKKAGFELVFANELSAMAGNTYAYNILNEDLENVDKSDSSLWIKSQFPRNEVSKRLKEFPRDASKGKYCDINPSTDVTGKLIIGDIRDLIDLIQQSNLDIKKLGEIDLLAGGPPCQSFSLAGKRELDNERNSLPFLFVDLASVISPKVVLIENVKGITSAFVRHGKSYYAWAEIAKKLQSIGYIPLSMLINSKYFGIPQNRSRFVLIGIRNDIFEQHKANNSNNSLLLSKLLESNASSFGNSKLLIQENNIELFNGLIFPESSQKTITVMEAIDDLSQSDIHIKQSEYVMNLNKSFINLLFNRINDIENHEYRTHSEHVRMRFRLYQVASEMQKGLKDLLFLALKRQIPISSDLSNFLMKQKLLFFDSGKEVLRCPRSETELNEYFNRIPTRKHSQTALLAYKPAPAQLTIPDDVCHYSIGDNRTLTVREMARIQSFPDGFIFKSKVTSGGQNRKHEVPQYTQVGNAIPPLLGVVLGQYVKKLIGK